jgi:hypothetical protein
MPYINLEYVYFKIYTFCRDVYHFLLGQEQLFRQGISVFKIVAFVLSFFFAAALVYSLFSLLQLRKKRLAEAVKTLLEHPPEERATNWDRVKKYLESDNSSDWRWAILEADNLLEDIIKKIGYEGETFGDRLSKIKPAQFKSLQDVWQAHKVRNRIVHEGEKYELTKGEAQKVVALYEKALEELEYI